MPVMTSQVNSAVTDSGGNPSRGAVTWAGWCRERGLKGYSRFTKAQCLTLLRGAPHLEQRLDRLEALLVLVAERVGVPVERITAVLKG